MTDIFVGRRNELEALRRGLDQACAGNGGLALLVGEAGIGKTAVAREFAEVARRRGSTVLWGHCFEGEWQPPYGPWVEALSDIVRASDGALLRRELGPVAPALAELVPDIRALVPDLTDAPSLRPDEGRFRVYDAVVRFLSRVAERTPCVCAGLPRVCAGLALILDDLHWADTDSLQLLRYVARALGNTRMFLVGTYREPEVGMTAQHPLMQTLALMRSEAGYQHLLLRGLEYPELTEYLTQAAGQALPQALVQAVYAETDGNPFYTHEIWQHLTEEAKILHRAGRWSTDSSIDELGIPEGVRQVVGRRLTRLSDETNAMLHVAACMGGEFDLKVLLSLGDLPEERLLDCLDEALEGGVLRVVTDVPPCYDFCHAIVRHTVYGTLNPDRRLRLHRRIALGLERLYADLERDHAAEIAAQYYAARGLPGAEQGVAYALMAAQQARAAYAHARAAALLRQARDLAPAEGLELQAEILTQLALAEAEALMLDEARGSAEEAVAALSAAAVEPRVQAEHLAAMARALKEGGSRSSVWEPLVERGLALLDEPHDLLWARLMLLRNRYEHIVSEPLHVSHWLGLDPEAVAIARASGDEDAYALTLEPLEWRTREETEAVLAIARGWHRPAAIMRALDVVGRDRLYRHGAHREGGACYTELLAVAERCGSIPAQAEAHGQIAVAQFAQGDLVAARRASDRVLEIVARLGIRHRLRMFLQALPSLIGYYVEADWPSLADEFTRYATDPALARVPAGTGPAAYAIYDHVRAGNEAEARHLLAALMPVLEHVEPTMYVHNVAVHLTSMAVWELGAAEYSYNCRRLLLDLVAAGVGHNWWGPHELMLARMTALSGAIDEAGDWFTKARAWAGDLQHRYLAAIIDYDEALARTRVGTLDHARVGALLNKALDAFQVLEMQGWVQRALALQAQLAASRTPASAAGLTYPDGLTTREVEVLCLVAEGMTNKGIAQRLVLSVPTVARHVANIYTKIDAHGRADATAYALRHALLSIGAAQPPA